MSYREKQQECKQRGLSATGKDTELLERLLGSSGSDQVVVVGGGEFHFAFKRNIKCTDLFLSVTLLQVLSL